MVSAKEITMDVAVVTICSKLTGVFSTDWLLHEFSCKPQTIAVGNACQASPLALVGSLFCSCLSQLNVTNRIHHLFFFSNIYYGLFSRWTYKVNPIWETFHLASLFRRFCSLVNKKLSALGHIPISSSCQCLYYTDYLHVAPGGFFRSDVDAR